jgi:nitrate reductase NapE
MSLMRSASETIQREQRNERLAIIFLAAIVAPILAVVTVAGYGFCVWMVQLIAGPPH